MPSIAASLMVLAAAAAEPEWTPTDGAAIVELVECHAHTEARLSEATAKLPAGGWTLAHQTLASQTAVHEHVGAILARAVDRQTRRALMEAYFPEGLATEDSAVRVDRHVRCTRLYGAIHQAALRAGARLPGWRAFRSPSAKIR
ncbi:MAG: hypothetical protein ACK4WC_14025 [Rubrimonas sp.]